MIITIRQNLVRRASWALAALVVLAGTLFSLTAAAAPEPAHLPIGQPVFQVAPTPSVEADRPQTTSEVFLPLISNTFSPVSEIYSIGYSGGVYKALGGRLTLTIPPDSLEPISGLYDLMVSTNPAGGSTLMSMEINIVRQGTSEKAYLWKPASIQINYSGLDLSFIPEADMVITGVPTTTVDTVHHTATGFSKHFSTFDLGWPPFRGITGMAAGKGGSIYVLAPPMLYQNAAGSSKLTPLVNLLDIVPREQLFNISSKLAYNPTDDSLFLSIGNHDVVYALKGNTLKPVFNLKPLDGRVDAMAYRASDKSLFLANTHLVSFWGYQTRILQVDPTTGTLVKVYADYGGYTSDLIVSASGKVVPSVQAICETSDLVNNPYDVNNQTFIGAQFMASDDQGNVYVANSGGNAISILSGPDLTVSGQIRVAQPMALAVAGGRILVVSEGRILEIPAGRRDATAGKAVFIPNVTLSGAGNTITVQAPTLDRIPAHNILTYNGQALGRSEFSCDMSQPKLVSYVVDPILLNPLPYIPINAQKAHLAFSIGGTPLGAVDIKAPEMPVPVITISSSPVITLTRNQWVQWGGAIESLESLFAPQGAGGLYQFQTTGKYHFKLTQSGDTKNIEIDVAPFSAPESNSAVINQAVGGVVWASGAALEIPAGALPSASGIYTVSLSSTAYANPSRDQLSNSSPLYNFSISPEPTHLNKALRLHLPYDEAGGPPKVAFYDPQIQDAIAVDSQADAIPGYWLFNIPAGDYPASTTQTGYLPAEQSAPPSQQPAVPKPSLFRRSLNWLGGTGLWHAVGLPNTNLQTDNFQVLFNTKDCSEAYAQTLLDALEKTLIDFTNRGYQMPTTQVIVKIAPWVAPKSTPGVTPGIGSLYNYYMFINNSLSTEDLQDTAAHEYFHVLQKENATVAGRYQNPVWFEEATATWAQYVVYPSHQGFFPDAQAGMSFMTVPFCQWGTLDYQQQYAAMSLAVYLEKEVGDGAVLQVMNQLGVAADMLDALNHVTGNWSTFYEKFAKDYWLQKFSPVDQWTLTDIGGGYLTRKFTDASNSFSVSAPALSSRFIMGYWDASTTPNPPTSFTQGVDSAAYLQNAVSCEAREVLIFDKAKQQKGSFLGNVEPDFGQPLSKLGDYTKTNPIYFLYINYTGGSANTDCAFTLVVDEPTITSLNPSSVKVKQATQITISGGGFGTKLGYVFAGGVTYTPSDWGPSSVTFTLPGQNTPGTISVRVQLPTGALSNPMTITLIP